jgi:2-keto-myo-inositol isomerase
VTVSRREFIAAPIVAGAVAATGSSLAAEAKSTKPPKFRYCLNTSTIRGQQLGIVKEVELAAKAGYDGIEPWIRELEAYVKDGGSLKDLGKRIADHGLRVESAIGFANWIVEDDAKRAEGLETAKRDMDMLKKIGGTHIAAPPVGAHRGSPKLDLFKVAERYRALLEVGDQTGIIPQAEVWGFSDNLSRLGETMFAVIESGHKDACILPDVYHIYKGGSDFAGMAAIAGSKIHCFHVNDYPADPPRDTISDKDRVYPGDGVAPLNDIFQMIAANGFAGVLSLELFNPVYWEQDAEQVVKTGLVKTKEAVAKAFS